MYFEKSPLRRPTLLCSTQQNFATFSRGSREFKIKGTIASAGAEGEGERRGLGGGRRESFRAFLHEIKERSVGRSKRRRSRRIEICGGSAVLTGRAGAVGAGGGRGWGAGVGGGRESGERDAASATEREARLIVCEGGRGGGEAGRWGGG